MEITYHADSSGTLMTQIEEGYACDIFFSAAEKQMDQLETDGFVVDGTRSDDKPWLETEGREDDSIKQKKQGHYETKKVVKLTFRPAGPAEDGSEEMSVRTSVWHSKKMDACRILPSERDTKDRRGNCAHFSGI